MNIGAFGVYLCLFFALYFEVFLLISFFEKRPAAKTKTHPKNFPSVSMVVPCWNEERTLSNTVQSLLALDYPQGKLEIIIVDDGSADGTRTIAESFVQQSHSARAVRFFHKENGGKYTALNLGIRNSKSDIVGCLDADSFVNEDALIEAVKHFESDGSIMAITPAMKVYRPRTMIELMQSVEYTFGIFYKKMFDNIAAVSVLPGPFSLYRKEVFVKIGPFRHAHNTEDMEIAFRMHAHGLKIANAHTAFVYTTVPKTIRTLFKQRVRWSQGFLENSRDYRHMYFNPRFGNFGMLALPLGLTAFCAGLYTAGYALYTILDAILMRVLDLRATGIPLHAPSLSQFGWFYLNTSSLSLLVIIALLCMVTSILIGQRISDTSLSPKAFISFFALFGFVAPLWLARAVWGALRSREASWR